MPGQKIYAADTVDSNGKVWDTVGENIRNGGKASVKEVVDKAIDDMLNAMYPVGYVYIGELPSLLKAKFTWKNGLPGVSGRPGLYISLQQTPGSRPKYLTNVTSPVLISDSELESFNSATGLSIPKGAVVLPVCYRTA